MNPDFQREVREGRGNPATKTHPEYFCFFASFASAALNLP